MASHATKKVLITGAGGQVGRALVAAPPAGIAPVALTRTDLDITDSRGTASVIAEHRPAVVVNTAAFTGVDDAESRPEEAKAINEIGARNVAEAAKAAGARLIHLSTDFVFDGLTSAPYAPSAETRPLSVYGRTKRDGENAVLETLPGGAVVVRAGWIYAAQGGNFFLTMLRLMREKRQVRVVADQIGTPTAAASIAEIVWALALEPALSGVFHWSDAGVASWYDFAVAIAEEAAVGGLLAAPVDVIPIRTRDYPTPARRPAFSVLDKSATLDAIDIVPRHWRANLRRVLAEVDASSRRG